MNKSSWSQELKQFIQARRQQLPIPPRESLSEYEEQQCRMIGGEFLGWSKRDFEFIQKQRYVLKNVSHFDMKPIVVLTSQMPGLVAFEEILAEAPEYLVYLLHDEFEDFQAKYPATPFNFHIHHWSYFEAIDPDALQKAQLAFPDIAPESFRIHHSGDLWGEQCGVLAQHLWHWDGQELQLLEEAFISGQF